SSRPRRDQARHLHRHGQARRRYADGKLPDDGADDGLWIRAPLDRRHAESGKSGETRPPIHGPTGAGITRPAALGAALVLAVQGVSAVPAVAPQPPSCATARVTPAETEGPFYKRGSPERTSLIEPGMPGTRITVTGYVLSTECRPVAGAWLDFWQADEQG